MRLAVVSLLALGSLGACVPYPGGGYGPAPVDGGYYGGGYAPYYAPAVEPNTIIIGGERERYRDRREYRGEDRGDYRRDERRSERPRPDRGEGQRQERARSSIPLYAGPQRQQAPVPAPNQRPAEEPRRAPGGFPYPGPPAEAGPRG